MGIFNKDWKDKLLDASFRGIPFFVEEHTITGGRHSVVHEFPNKKEPFTEDLGRKARTFPITGHILGDDYFSVRDKIQKACEEEGPGELIHPYLGILEVNCKSFSINEQTKKGRIAFITFEFVETGSFSFPSEFADRIGGLVEEAQSTIEAIQEVFEGIFTILRLPGALIDSARDAVEFAADAFEFATQPFAVFADEAANLAFSIRNLKAEVNDLLAAPGELAARLTESLSLLSDTITTPEAAEGTLEESIANREQLNINRDGAIAAYNGLTAHTGPEIEAPFQTPERIQEAANTAAIDSLVRQVSIVRSIENSAVQTFPTSDEAIEQREFLAELIETELETTTDDVLFQSFSNLKAALVDTVPDPDSDLPGLVEFTPVNTIPSLVLVYDIFEAPENEQDIIDRNNIRHPGFVPGGETLEVVSG